MLAGLLRHTPRRLLTLPGLAKDFTTLTGDVDAAATTVRAARNVPDVSVEARVPGPMEPRP